MDRGGNDLARRALERAAGQWMDPGRGARYAAVRWRRRAARDPRAVARLLAQHTRPGAVVVDVPAGSARLAAAIAQDGRHWIGFDVSAAMLAAVPAPRTGHIAIARAERLPLGDHAADAVVCCRLLHHVHEPAARSLVLHELARVARELVLVSFWDRAAWPSLRRAVAGGGQDRAGRAAIGRADFAAELDAAGLELIGFHAVLRFFSAQTFAIARPRRR